LNGDAFGDVRAAVTLPPMWCAGGQGPCVAPDCRQNWSFPYPGSLLERRTFLCSAGLAPGGSATIAHVILASSSPDRVSHARLAPSILNDEDEVDRSVEALAALR
jgi:hypothetical protein